MGCDIHQRTWVWSKPDRKYLDIHEIDEYDSYTYKPLFTGRYYDFFALFGVRGNRFQIPDSFISGFGCPDFASKIFKKMYVDCPYHSGVWFYPKDLNEALEDRIELMERLQTKYKGLKKRYPKNWYLHWEDNTDCDSDEYNNDDYMWYEGDDDHLLSCIKDVKELLKPYLWTTEDYDFTLKYIDPAKTVIFFYFDS